MANIKFSDFTVGNTEGDIDFVVGYKGASNIQISPTNLLASALGNYLPLAGGTMTGTSGVIFPDTFKLNLGTSSDFNIYHSGSHSYLENYTGDIIIQNNANDKDIIFQSDDGAGNVTEYFTLDGSRASGAYTYTTRPDGGVITFGDSLDLRLWHDPNTNKSYMRSYNHDLYIEAITADTDILFRADDGGGGIATYFTLDGSLVQMWADKDIQFSDNIKAKFGSSSDLKIYHNATDSSIINETGRLLIEQKANDGDIVFYSDDGTGNVAQYFRVDGGVKRNIFSQDTNTVDNIGIYVGTGLDFGMYHDGTHTYLTNDSQAGSNLYIRNATDDGDTIFQGDNGSGNLSTYFYLDGSLTNGSSVLGATRFPDKSKIYMGSGGNLQIFHDGSNSYISNSTGALYIQQHADDSDIVFQSDDGSGGITEYFRVDGDAVKTIASKNFAFLDGVQIELGDSGDFNMSHNGTDATLQNFTGNFNIVNKANDKDIIFQSDDGSGGVATYFFLDGSTASSPYVYTRFPDNSVIFLGDGGDAAIFHDGTDTRIKNETGDLFISQFANDKDIVFRNDNGSGGVVEYLRLDGSSTKITINKEMQFFDNVKATFGFAADLSIYHDGSNSYIQDSGTGELKLLASSLAIQSASGNEYIAYFAGTGGQTASLYAGNVKKLETKSTGINIQGVTEYADNTAALAGGLTTGDVYRTGDLLKIVH